MKLSPKENKRGVEEKTSKAVISGKKKRVSKYLFDTTEERRGKTSTKFSLPKSRKWKGTDKKDGRTQSGEDSGDTVEVGN